MSALEAARLGDEIGHSSALGGLLTGIVVGIALAVAVVAIVGTGGVAAVAIGAGIAAAGAGGGLAGMHIGELVSGKKCSGIKEGSHDTDIEGKPAARAGLDESGHNSKLVAQGSSTVFVNQHMLARKTDKIECGGKVKTFAKTVLVGGEVATAPGMHIDEEVPGWLVTTLKVVAIAGTVVATGGVAAVAGWGVALGGLGGGVLGGYGFGWVGRKVGGWIGGELGARIGETVGGFAGGMLGGMAGARLGGWLRPPPTPPTELEPPLTGPARLSKAAQRMVDEGPNRWVETGAQPEGVLLQRGCTGDYASGLGGLRESKEVLAGTWKSGQTFSVIRNQAEIPEVTGRVTSVYNDPMAIQGRMPKDVLMPGRSGDGEAFATRAMQPDEISALGSFSPQGMGKDGSYSWGRQYLRMQDELGIQPAPGSRGAAFNQELKQALGTAKLEQDALGMRVTNVDEVGGAVEGVLTKYQ